MIHLDSQFSRQDIEDTLDFAVSGGGEFAELFFERKKSLSILMEDRRAEKITSGWDAGFGLRIVNSGRTAYGYSNIITRSEMMKICKRVLEEHQGSRGDMRAPGTLQGGKVEGIEIEPEVIPVNMKVDNTFIADSTARCVSSEIVQVSVRYGESLQEVEIYNSEGIAVADTRRQLLFSVRAVASDGTNLQTAYRSAGGRRGFEFLSRELVERLGSEAAESAVRMLHAPSMKGGTMPVVLGSEAGGTMIHEAIGHGLEGDAVSKDQSVYSGKIGEKVASGLVTVVDDATLPGRRGSFNFDDEGNPAMRSVLVERGVLKGYMHDRYSAKKLGQGVTGNARRQSFRFRPIVRMSNTLIAPGSDDPAAIVSSVDEGLYVARMGGGQVDTSSGDFVFKVSEGFMIRKGKISEAVRGATLVGNGPDILKNIDMVGDDTGFDIGTCGKDGQHVPVADAQPTLRIPAITVGGEAEEA